VAKLQKVMKDKLKLLLISNRETWLLQQRLETVNSLKDVKESDHLFTIMSDTEFYDRYESKWGSLHGLADLGGLKVMLPVKTVNDMLDGTNKRTLPHEVAHTGGLYHPSFTSLGDLQYVNDKYDQNEHYNLMNLSNITRERLKTDEEYNKAIKLKRGQLMAIYKNFQDGRINQDTKYKTTTYYQSSGHVPYITTFTVKEFNYAMLEYVSFRDQLFDGPKY